MPEKQSWEKHLHKNEIPCFPLESHSEKSLNNLPYTPAMHLGWKKDEPDLF